MNKTCKQCLNNLPDTAEYFKPYTPRGTGLRKTTVGRNTICRECEHLNGTATRIWKRGAQTPKETELLDKLQAYYKVLVDRGGHPIGAYANHVLQQTREPLGRGKTSSIDEMLGSLTVALESGDPLIAEYDRLLDIEFTEEPDYYQDLLEGLRTSTAGPDGRVKDKYKEKFDEVATRFDDYEDNYQWD